VSLRRASHSRYGIQSFGIRPSQPSASLNRTLDLDSNRKVKIFQKERNSFTTNPYKSRNEMEMQKHRMQDYSESDLHPNKFVYANNHEANSNSQGSKKYILSKSIDNTTASASNKNWHAYKSTPFVVPPFLQNKPPQSTFAFSTI